MLGSLALNLTKIGVNDRAIDDRILCGKQQRFADLIWAMSGMTSSGM
jgi:hypothetical protein